MFSVYIIKNKDGKIYIGQTDNLERRIIEHNETGVGYTAKFRPWEIMLEEKFSTRSRAMRREHYLKTGAGRDWIKKSRILSSIG